MESNPHDGPTGGDGKRVVTHGPVPPGLEPAKGSGKYLQGEKVEGWVG